MNEEALVVKHGATWTERAHVRAFYSGHSLSDGVPEAVARTADALGTRLDFEVQSIGYSLLRDRTRGTESGGADSAEWLGYRRGSNRVGQGLDVREELRRPSRIGAGAHYDALVVTERHDLPEVAVHGETATYLADIATQTWAGSPAADVFFYHTWLALDVRAPQRWIAYERKAERLWECVASRANLDVAPPADAPAARRIRVLPGASALAAAVEQLWSGAVPGLSQPSASERVRLLFADDVHLSPIGTYYMGLVHYAVLFGRSPAGAPSVDGLPDAAAAHLQRLASSHAAAYAERADAASARDMEHCRRFAEHELCPAFHALRARGAGMLGQLKRAVKTLRCARAYGSRDDPHNPFRVPTEKAR